MATHIRLGAILNSYNLDRYQGITGEKAYKFGMKFNSDMISNSRLNEHQPIIAIKNYTNGINRVLDQIDQGNPRDQVGPIDLPTQIEELDHLTDAGRNLEKIIRDFLATEQGKVKWKNGICHLTRKSTVNIADKCAELNTLIDRIQAVKGALRRPIDRQNTIMLTPMMTFLPPDLIPIIGQYMNSY